MSPTKTTQRKTSPSSNARVLRTTLRCLVGAATLCACVVGVARANPVEEALRAKVMRDIEAINAARSVKKVGEAHKATLRRAITALAKAHNQSKDKATQKSIQRALGKVLRTLKLGTDVRMRAADALGTLNALKAAFRELKGSLPSPRDKTSGPVELAVIAAAGNLAPDTAIRPLEQLVMTSVNPQVVERAAAALGYFTFSAKRVHVFDVLIARLQRRPGAPKKGAKSSSNAAGYAASWKLAETAVIYALNRLTGREILTSEAWIVTARSHRKMRKKLFKIER